MPPECPRLNDVLYSGYKVTPVAKSFNWGEIEGKNEKREPLGLPHFLFHGFSREMGLKTHLYSNKSTARFFALAAR